jgi:hypothetical protein
MSTQGILGNFGCPFFCPLNLTDDKEPCGSWLACDGGLTADHVLSGVHIHFCGNGHLWFRPYGESLLSNAVRVNVFVALLLFYQLITALVSGRFFAPVSIRGHCPPVCFATTYMQRVRLRRTALRATPRMNTSTQPPERGGQIKIKSRRANARPNEW